MQIDQYKIKQLRQQRGWTQQQTADIANLSIRTVQRVELNGTASVETTRSLAAILEIEFEALLLDDSIEKLKAPETSQAGFQLRQLAIGVLLGVAITLVFQLFINWL